MIKGRAPVWVRVINFLKHSFLLEGIVLLTRNSPFFATNLGAASLFRENRKQMPVDVLAFAATLALALTLFVMVGSVYD
jgi:hypothetical protein